MFAIYKSFVSLQTLKVCQNGKLFKEMFRKVFQKEKLFFIRQDLIY